MKITGVVMLFMVGILMVSGFACDSGSSEKETSLVSPVETTKMTQPTATAVSTTLSTETPSPAPSPTPTQMETPTETPSPSPSPTPPPDPTLAPPPTPTPSLTPSEPPECEEDRQAIKSALDAYYAANGQWPTADGQPGLIAWDKLVPELMEKTPSTINCKWQVNSDPLGEVCRSVHC